MPITSVVVQAKRAQLVPRRYSHLGENSVKVPPDGPGREEQALTDFTVRQAGSGELSDLTFLGAEVVAGESSGFGSPLAASAELL